MVHNSGTFQLSENSVSDVSVCSTQSVAPLLSLLYLSGDNHWNRKPFHHMARILIYVTDAAVIRSLSPSTPALLSRPIVFRPYTISTQVCRGKKETYYQGGGPPTKSIKSSIKISSLAL